MERLHLGHVAVEPVMPSTGQGQAWEHQDGKLAGTKMVWQAQMTTLQAVSLNRCPLHSLFDGSRLDFVDEGAENDARA